MKTLLLFIGIFMFTTVFANTGEDLFKTTCAACHTIGKGRLVGPDLKGITEKRSQDWLVSFVKSSTSMVNSGDADAKAIFAEYNNLLMPDNSYSDEQVIAILHYIKEGSSGSGEMTDVQPVEFLIGVTTENVETGLHIFAGNQRLTNGGPACSSCHKVTDERIFSSGTLSKDLSESYDNMGSAGLAAIINSPPYPIMRQAYKNHALTKEEIFDLTAYLKSVSKERIYQRPSEFSMVFAFFGIMFCIAIFMSTIILYFNRKKLPVNHDILSRTSKVIN